jgi:integrase
MLRAKNLEIEDRIVWLMDSKTESRPAFFLFHTQTILEALRSVKDPWEGELFPDVDTVKKMIYRVLRALGLKGKADGRGPHTFRHYVTARMFYVGGMRIEEIAFLLGDTTDTVVQNYLQPTPLMLKERVQRAMGWEE